MMIVREITTLDDTALDLFTRLTESQLRSRVEPEKGVFIAESPKVISIALHAGMQPVAVLVERKFFESQVAPMSEWFDGTTVYVGERKLLATLTGYELSRGMICAMRRPAMPPAEQICGGRNRIALVDGVVNATNTGAIFRAAAGLGVDALLFTHTCCDPLNRRSVRVSMGTVFQVPWTTLPHNAAQAVEWLGTQGFKTVAMALSDNAVSIDTPSIAAEERLAIVLGNEGDGLSHDTVAQCDYVAKIPMQNGVDSLNVAAAAAVAFWQLRR